jgi:hypothetical protein
MSNQGIPIFNLSVIATTAILANRCVNYQGAQVSVLGGEVMGIATHPANVGERVTLACLGSFPIESGAVVAIGNALVSDAQGRAVRASPLTMNDGTLSIAAGATPVTSTAASGAGIVVGSPGFNGCELPHHLIGYALQPAPGAGRLIESKLSV